MTKKLFLSCYSKELSVANELKKHLEYGFNPNLTIESPLEDMKCGDDWRNYIKDHLRDCDGLISLITPAYAKRAWCIAEFIPFWMADKKVFPVTIGFEDTSTDIFRLIADKYQTARLEDAGDVEKLLEAIGEFCGASKPNIKYLDNIVTGCGHEYNKIIAEESGIDADKVLFSGNRYIRQFLSNSTVWEFSLNKSEQGVLSAICTKELSFVIACDDTKYIEMPLRALTEENIDFEVINFDAGGKKVNIGSLTKSAESVFTYRINFKPALKRGEAITIKYKIIIPQCKLATTEKALEVASSTKSERIELRKESISVRIDAPTDRFCTRVIFAPECNVAPQEIQAKWNNEINTEELDFIRSNKCYTDTFHEEDGCVLELIRQKPKPGITYSFSWALPSQADFSLTESTTFEPVV